MSVFTDGVTATIEDLRAYESSILETAHTEGIDLTAKLVVSQEEVAVELEALLAKLGSGRYGLDNVVVTRPLKQWMVFHTLAVVYRDAYNSQLNDRYMGKWKEYGQMAKWAAQMLRENGVGVVRIPIPKAAEPLLEMTPGPGAAGRYYVQAAWRNATGAEGAPSPIGVIDTSDGMLLTVEAVNPPTVAAGWSVYVGAAPDAMRLQNEEALAVGEKWTASAAGLVNGRAPGLGQAPEEYLTLDRIIQRG